MTCLPTLRLWLTPTLLAASVVLAAAPPARAADLEPVAAAPATDRLAPARALIAQDRWREAVAALQQLGDTASADWNNLMGYSLRKAKTPDLEAAERYYNAALRIDPQHRGALEYSGELYLMKGDLPRAQERLATLDQVCAAGCDEQKDLRGAIAAFKANGNRHVAAP